MNARISLLTALVDLALLGVLIVVGMYAGAAAGHQIGVGTILLEYGGVSTLVGFGLVNRIVRASMFRIVNPSGIVIALVFSILLGYFVLPSIVIWKVWRVVVAMIQCSEGQPRRHPINDLGMILGIAFLSVFFAMSSQQAAASNHFLCTHASYAECVSMYGSEP